MKEELKLYMAPFQGITGTVYREVYTRHFSGIDKLYTPFFTAIHKSKSLNKKAYELLFTSHHGVSVVPQILSKDPEEIIRFGNYCHEQGFNEINWNLGCPYPRVANKKRGSGMLPFPDMLEDILDRVMPELNINFSVKCRLGYFMPDEILKLIPIINHFKIYELTIHARIGTQMYKGEVDDKSFDRARKIARVPVVYNGDIFSVHNFNNFYGKFQDVNAWMIGRGLLIDPFLPGDIKDLFQLNMNDRKLIVKTFIEELYLTYRRNKNNNLNTIGTMKELWSHLAFSFERPVKVFNAIKKTKSFDAYEDSVKYVFDNFAWLGSEGKIVSKY